MVLQDRQHLQKCKWLGEKERRSATFHFEGDVKGQGLHVLTCNAQGDDLGLMDS